jgi:hypothetical protein
MVYTLSQIQEKVIPVCRDWGLTKLMLFGSYARGEATADSDIDLVVYDDEKKLSGSNFYALVGDLRDLLQPSKVEVVGDSEIMGIPWLAEAIASEGVALYES